jgi:hypothetical protein
MQSDAIVVLLDERGNVRTQVVEISIGIGVDLFPLERLHDALTTGVVIGVGRPAHAREHVVRSQPGHVRVGGILDAAIGLMHPPRRRVPLCEGMFQRCDRQPGGQRAVQRPADDLAGLRIEHYRQIDELRAQANIGEVCDRELIHPGEGQAASQVECHL